MSLDTQRAKLHQYADLHEVELVDVLADEGVSGATLDRPGLQRVLALLHSGQVDGLVVTKLDRLTRRTRDLLDLVEELFRDRSLALVSIIETIDTTHAGGRLVLGVLGLLAQWERETIQERTKAALARLRSEGVWLGQLPLGVRYGGERNEHGRRVVLHAPEEKLVVRRIRNLRRRGYSLREIAARLEADGVPTKRGGTRWHAKVIRDALMPKPAMRIIEGWCTAPDPAAALARSRQVERVQRGPRSPRSKA